MSVALVRIQIRNDLAVTWAALNPYLADGEPGAESDTGRLKIGNGSDRWLDLPYVGGGSGGGGGPLTGVIDGGVYTGVPSNVQCGPPQSPAASQVVDPEGVRRVIVSWGPAYPFNPELTKITGYEVQYALSSQGEWYFAGQTVTEENQSVPNFAYVEKPEPRDPTASYFYRVKAILDPTAESEWGYTGEYRHFQEPEPTEFSLSPDGATLGSVNAVDNSLTVYITNLRGDVQNPVSWEYPNVTGLRYQVETDQMSLKITNDRGANTQNQTIVVQCTVNGVTESATVNIEMTTPDPDGPDPIGGSQFIPVFNWEYVPEGTDDLEQAWLPGMEVYGKLLPPYENFDLDVEPGYECGYDDNPPCPSDPGVENCGVRPSTLIDFSGFSIIMQSPYSGPLDPGDTGDFNETPVNHFAKLTIPGGDCSVGNLKKPDGTNLQIPNPLYVTGLNEELIPEERSAMDESGADDIIQPPRDKFTFLAATTAYQIVDNVEINGLVASYLLGHPYTLTSKKIQERDGDREPIETERESYASGFLMYTRNGGTTWDTISPKGGDGYKIGPDSENSFPLILAKAVSTKNGQEVLVAMYKFQTEGGLVEQFYFTVDHTNWYPCTNADRLPPDVDLIWEHQGVTYATGPEYTGYKAGSDTGGWTQPRKPYYRSPPREQ